MMATISQTVKKRAKNAVEHLITNTSERLWIQGRSAFLVRSSLQERIPSLGLQFVQPPLLIHKVVATCGIYHVSDDA